MPQSQQTAVKKKILEFSSVTKKLLYEPEVI